MRLIDRPLLAWVVSRLQDAHAISEIAVSTSNEEPDDKIAEYCLKNNILCFRGPLNNVAKRLSQAVSTYDACEFIRISGDSPLIDPKVVDHAAHLFLKTQCDLVTNVLTRSFPKGQSVEILNSTTLQNLCNSMDDPKDQEHVTRLYYRTKQHLKIIDFSSGANMGAEQLSVDTREDFEMISRLITASNGAPGGWRELVELKQHLSL